MVVYMVVYVEGECDIELTHSVVAHCFNELIPTHDVNINVLVRDIQTDNINGWYQWTDDHNSEISVDKSLSKNQFIKTLCHEMVHVKKGVKKELEESKYCRSWLGTEYKLLSGTEYTGQFPWEAEAYYLENKLYNSFMVNNKK